MKYQFKNSEVSPLSNERILISCWQRSNQGDGEFHQHLRIRCHLNWRMLVISCLWGQEFFSPRI